MEQLGVGPWKDSLCLCERKVIHGLGHSLAESTTFSYQSRLLAWTTDCIILGGLYTSADISLLIAWLCNTWKYWCSLQLIYKTNVSHMTTGLHYYQYSCEIAAVHTTISNFCMKILASATCKWSNNGCEGPCRSPIDPIDVLEDGFLFMVEQLSPQCPLDSFAVALLKCGPIDSLADSAAKVRNPVHYRDI